MALQATFPHVVVPPRIEAGYPAFEKIWVRCHNGFLAQFNSPPSRTKRLEAAKFIVLAQELGVWSEVVWPAMLTAERLGSHCTPFKRTVHMYITLVKILKEFGPRKFYGGGNVKAILMAAFVRGTGVGQGEGTDHMMSTSRWSNKVYQLWYDMFTWSNVQWEELKVEDVLRAAEDFRDALHILMTDLLDHLVTSRLSPEEQRAGVQQWEIIRKALAELLSSRVFHFFDLHLEGRSRSNATLRLLFSKMATAHSVTEVLQKALVYRSWSSSEVAVDDRQRALSDGYYELFDHPIPPHSDHEPRAIQVTCGTVYYWYPLTLQRIRDIGIITGHWCLEDLYGQNFSTTAVVRALEDEWVAWGSSRINKDLFRTMCAKFHEKAHERIGFQNVPAQPIARLLNNLARRDHGRAARHVLVHLVGEVEDQEEHIPPSVAWLQNPEFFPPPEPAAGARPVDVDVGGGDGGGGERNSEERKEPHVQALEAPHGFWNDDVETLLGEAWSDLAAGYQDFMAQDLIQSCPVVVRLHDGRLSSQVYELESIKAWVTSQVSDQRRRFPERVPVVKDPHRDGDVAHDHPDGWYFQPNNVWRGFQALVKALRKAKADASENVELASAIPESRERVSCSSDEEEPRPEQHSRKRQRIVPAVPRVKEESALIDLTNE